MSTQQRNDAYVIAVDPLRADVLRRQALIILEANHHYFEEILEFGPEAQYALSVRYRDAFAVLDALGWRRPDDPPAATEVTLTTGFLEQLHQRRYELGHANIDRLAVRDATHDPQERARIDAEIAADLAAIKAIDNLFAPVPAA
jgi:hypothetical protein